MPNLAHRRVGEKSASSRTLGILSFGKSMAKPFHPLYPLGTSLVFPPATKAPAYLYLPCGTEVVKCRAKNISVDALTKSLNCKLRVAPSHIINLQLNSAGNLKVAGSGKGTSISVSGFSQVTAAGGSKCKSTTFARAWRGKQR